MNIPEGMLPVEEYAKRNGIDVAIVISRIRDAEYIVILPQFLGHSN